MLGWPRGWPAMLPARRPDMSKTLTLQNSQNLNFQGMITSWLAFSGTPAEYVASGLALACLTAEYGMQVSFSPTFEICTTKTAWVCRSHCIQKIQHFIPSLVDCLPFLEVCIIHTISFFYCGQEVQLWIYRAD